MSIRRMMLFTLGAKIKNLIEAFKTRVFAAQGEFEAETCLDAQLTDLDNKGLLDSASFVVTPNGYEENLLFAVSPNTSTADLTVTRATLGTRVNADGDIEQVPYNYYSFSEQFDNSYWNKGDGTGTRVTVNPNQAIAPDGNMTADLLIPTTTLIEHSINATIFANTLLSSVALANLLTFSVYVKPAGYNFFIMRNNINNIWTSGVIFNIQTGTIVSAHPSYVSSNITSVGDGWYRLSVTTQNVTNTIFQMYSSPTGAITFSGDGVSGAYIWGAQLVVGTQPRDYFPTTNRFNVPRIDYSNGSCPSILVEPQRTNIALRSEEFENASWIKNESSIISNSTISPSGVQNADSFIENTATALHQCIFNTSAASGIYTATIYAKPNGRNWLFFNIAAAANYGVWFDIQNGVVGTIQSNITSASITNAGNGWYRCIITANTGAISPRISLTLSTGNNNISYLGNGTSGIFIWGAQLELGANATSYIPTVASTVTRNADVITNTNASTLIGQTEGTLFVDSILLPSTSANLQIYRLDDGTDNNRLRVITASAQRLRFLFQLNGNVIQYDYTYPNSYTTPTRLKIAIAYKSGDIAIYLNGILINSSTNALTISNNLSRFILGDGSGATYQSTNLAMLYKTRLTNSQLATLTTL